jgi:hypothetical protein
MSLEPKIRQRVAHLYDKTFGDLLVGMRASDYPACIWRWMMWSTSTEQLLESEMIGRVHGDTRRMGRHQGAGLEAKRSEQGCGSLEL